MQTTFRCGGGEELEGGREGVKSQPPVVAWLSGLHAWAPAGVEPAVALMHPCLGAGCWHVPSDAACLCTFLLSSPQPGAVFVSEDFSTVGTLTPIRCGPRW